MANIKSIGGNPIVLGLDGLTEEAKAALGNGKLSSTSESLLGTPDTAQWATRESTGSGAATVRSVQGAAVVQDSELVPVQIAGIQSVGFNQWDEEWELGTIASATGQNVADNNTIRSKNYNSCFPGMDYYIKAAKFIYVFWYDTEKNFISRIYLANNVSQSPANAAYFRIRVDGAATYDHNICINVSNPALNGQYKPYITDSVEWTAQTLRAAGSVRDELTADELVTRVGVRAYQAGDESDATVRTDGTTTYYPLATPTTTPISPALPMTYRVQQGGTESIIVPAGEISAAPVLTIAEGESAAELVMDALACIATPDGPVATSNHAVGTYLTMQGKLYKVTSAIAVGETITAGTNVTVTTVMDEILALN